MIYKTLKSAIPYAQSLSSRGIILNLPNQSHLTSILAASCPVAPQDITTSEAFCQSVEDVVMVDGSISDYDNVSTVNVDDLERIVLPQIRVARQIGGLCQTFAESVQKYMDAAPGLDASNDFNVVKDELGELFDQGSVLTDLQESRDLISPDKIRPVTTAQLDFDSIMGLVLTGNANIDSHLHSLVAAYDAGFLENVYYGFFNTSTRMQTQYNPYNLRTLASGERLAVSYLVYLMACRLYNNVDEQAVGTLNEYQTAVADIRDFALSVASNALNERYTQIKNKVVVFSYNPASKTVVVNGPLYREWLEAGGKVEIVLGALLKDPTAFTAERLNYSGDEFIRAWNAYCAIYNADSDLKRSRYLRSIYNVVMTEMISDIQPYEEDYRKAHPSHAESCLRRTQETVDATGLKALQCPEKMALELIAGIRFDYTPSKMILEDIDAVLCATPDTNPREAALIAACNYLALYMTGQMTVSRQ